jgi:predicted O-methyltransferase YrrM
MDIAVQKVLEEQAYSNDDGIKVNFTSSIDVHEAIFLESIINTIQPARTIEIGCAEGASSLVILSSLRKEGALHTIVDPFQSTYWQSKGIRLLNEFRLQNFRLIEKGSEIALPNLLDQNEKFDFAFIDGYHTFDHTLIDAFYLIRMLNPGGILVIDDVQMPAINKCLRYLYNYPCLEFYGNSGNFPVTGSRKIFNSLKAGIAVFSKIMPVRWRTEIFDGSVLKSDDTLKLRSSMVAFRKIAEDSREWNWWHSF